MSVPHQPKLHHPLQLKYLRQIILPGAKWYLLVFMWMLLSSFLNDECPLHDDAFLDQIKSPVQSFELPKGKNKCIQELLHLKLKKLPDSSQLFIVQFRYAQIAFVIATVSRLSCRYLASYIVQLIASYDVSSNSIIRLILMYLAQIILILWTSLSQFLQSFLHLNKSGVGFSIIQLLKLCTVTQVQLRRGLWSHSKVVST